jgi:hypothetical protein
MFYLGKSTIKNRSVNEMKNAFLKNISIWMVPFRHSHLQSYKQ